MIDGLKDKHVEIILRVAKKKTSGLRPFFSNPRAMIGLRNEAAKRGIYMSDSERSRIAGSVFAEIQRGGKGK